MFQDDSGSVRGHNPQQGQSLVDGTPGVELEWELPFSLPTENGKMKTPAVNVIELIKILLTEICLAMHHIEYWKGIYLLYCTNEDVSQIIQYCVHNYAICKHIEYKYVYFHNAYNNITGLEFNLKH